MRKSRGDTEKGEERGGKGRRKGRKMKNKTEEGKGRKDGLK
jgi:hypothetical protein